MSASKSRWIPEICAIGLVVVVGAIFWTNHIAPKTPEVLETPAVAAPNPGPGDGAFHDGWKTASQFQKQQASKSITAQLEAFKKDDYVQAVKYQSSTLRRNFASVQQFRGMMKAAYPQFANYKKVDFGKALASPDGIFVQVAVKLTGGDGVKVLAVYTMRRESGLYRVDGVAGGGVSTSEGISA